MSDRQLTKNRVRYCPGKEEVSLEELVLSKTRLAVECSKEILRLTDMVKVLREDTKAMKAALISGDPLPFSSSLTSTASKPSSPLDLSVVSHSQKLRNIRKNEDIFVRRMHGSKQFERPDLSEVLLGQLIDDSEKKSAHQKGVGPQSMTAGKDDNSDEYEVETVIKAKRGEGVRTEYQVRKRIIYSRWQTLKDLEKDNLHDFAKIYDFKVRDSKLNLDNETLEKRKQIFAPVEVASDDDWDASSSERFETSRKAYKQGHVVQSNLVRATC